MRVISMFFGIFLLACTAGAASAQTAQQLGELKQAVCEFYNNDGKLLRSEPPIGVSGADAMVGYDTGLVPLSQERYGAIEFKTARPYTVVCGRYPLKHGEKCFAGKDCSHEGSRPWKDCGGARVLVKLPEGSSVRVRHPGCWHLARPE